MNYQIYSSGHLKYFPLSQQAFSWCLNPASFHLSSPHWLVNIPNWKCFYDQVSGMYIPYLDSLGKLLTFGWSNKWCFSLVFQGSKEVKLCNLEGKLKSTSSPANIISNAETLLCMRSIQTWIKQSYSVRQRFHLKFKSTLDLQVRKAF